MHSQFPSLHTPNDLRVTTRTPQLPIMAPSRDVFNAAIKFAEDSEKVSGSLNKAIQAHLQKETGMDKDATSKIAPWIMFLADKPTATFLKTNKELDPARAENIVLKMIVEAMPKPKASESMQTQTAPLVVEEESKTSEYTTDSQGQRVKRGPNYKTRCANDIRKINLVTPQSTAKELNAAAQAKLRLAENRSKLTKEEEAFIQSLDELTKSFHIKAQVA